MGNRGKFILINSIVLEKEFEYMEKYHKSPNYLKVPLFVYEIMKEQYRELLTSNLSTNYKNEVETFRGMILCPTVSIERVEEIEVF